MNTYSNSSCVLFGNFTIKQDRAPKEPNVKEGPQGKLPLLLCLCGCSPCPQLPSWTSPFCHSFQCPADCILHLGTWSLGWDPPWSLGLR